VAGAFARAGDVLLVSRGIEELERVVAKLKVESNRDIRGIAVDVAAPNAVDMIMEEAQRFDVYASILVNNAYSSGSTFGTSIYDVVESTWIEVMETNLYAPLRLTKSFGRAMIEHGGGSIINVLSGSGFLPTETLGPYGTSKSALWMLTRYFALESAPMVRVNAICPGVISEDGQPRTGSQALLLKQVPMKRMGHPDEVAGAAVYLASDASSYTTGEVIFVNGGRPW
jgi:NAD(P)-dependent dehydrogenase (short-subunit alcohol dehydrogenase family)